MNIIRFYPVSYIYKNQSYFFIYRDAPEKDTYYIENNRLILSYSESAISMFASYRKLTPYDSEYIPTFNLSYTGNLTFSTADFDSKELIDTWNLFDDLFESIPFIGKNFGALSEEGRFLHSRLMYEIDLFGEKGIKQEWDKEDLASMKKLFSTGFEMFQQAIDNAIVV